MLCFVDVDQQSKLRLLFSFLLICLGLLSMFLQPSVLERHFKDLQKKYGAVLAVDLVNTVSTVLSAF